MELRQLIQRVRPGVGVEDSARLSRELSRLDPWSYWIVQASAEDVGDFIVVGTTGAYLVAGCDHEGYLTGEGTRLSVSGQPVNGLSDVRRSARRIRGRLASAAVFSEVVSMICLTRAVAGAPRTIRGVEVLKIEDLVRGITDREKVLLPNRAQRGARSLGMVLPREQRAEHDDPE